MYSTKFPTKLEDFTLQHHENIVINLMAQQLFLGLSLKFQDYCILHFDVHVLYRCCDVQYNNKMRFYHVSISSQCERLLLKRIKLATCLSNPLAYQKWVCTWILAKKVKVFGLGDRWQQKLTYTKLHDSALLYMWNKCYHSHLFDYYEEELHSFPLDSRQKAKCSSRHDGELILLCTVSVLYTNIFHSMIP